MLSADAIVKSISGRRESAISQSAVRKHHVNASVASGYISTHRVVGRSVFDLRKCLASPRARATSSCWKNAIL